MAVLAIVGYRLCLPNLLKLVCTAVTKFHFHFQFPTAIFFILRICLLRTNPRNSESYPTLKFSKTLFRFKLQPLLFSSFDFASYELNLDFPKVTTRSSSLKRSFVSNSNCRFFHPLILHLTNLTLIFRKLLHALFLKNALSFQTPTAAFFILWFCILRTYRRNFRKLLHTQVL